jgi:hypothetical protein
LFLGNLDAEEAKIKSEIENLLEKLNKKAVTIEILQSKLSAVKLYASDLQTFLGGCIYFSTLFLYLAMDFSSLVRDFCKIFFPVPYHTFHVTGNVFQSILNTVKHS